jgi:hypothetical protein
MNIETILTAFGSVVTALGLQKVIPALASAWIRRKRERAAESLEHEKVQATAAVEIERIESAQLLERERLAFSREQEFHRLEMVLRQELQNDREELRARVSAVAAELAEVRASNWQCHRERQRLVRAMHRQERKCRAEIRALKDAFGRFRAT